MLLSLDYDTPGRTAHKGTSPDNDFAVAWIRQAGSGRVFYCSLGHREEIYCESHGAEVLSRWDSVRLGDLKADDGLAPPVPQRNRIT